MENLNQTQRLQGEPVKLSELVGQKVVVTGLRLMPAEGSKYGKPYAIVQLSVDGKQVTTVTSNIMGLENEQVPFDAEVVTGQTPRGTYYAIRRQYNRNLDGEFCRIDDILGIEGTVDDFAIARGKFGEYAIIQFSTPDATVKFTTGSQPIMKDLDNIKGEKGVFAKATSKMNGKEYYCFRPS